MTNKILLFIILNVGMFEKINAQSDSVLSYTKKTYLIPMRDGVKLFTEVLSPTGNNVQLPILIQRTPYGVPYNNLKDGETISTDSLDPHYRLMSKAGYIFVFQDMRGRFKSEGLFEMDRPLYHVNDKSKTDESTDAYDMVDWLVKNIPYNNGKAGIFGVSYLGTTALQALSDPHPALKASSPQAAPVDMFLGDDEHHNGAFRFAYSFEYSYYIEYDKTTNSNFPFPQFDLFNWYLKLGSLKNVNDIYFKKRYPSWNTLATHPNYDSHWKTISPLTYIQHPAIPVLFVGGYFDQEDLNGPQLMYNTLEKKDSFNRNYLVLGPWNHGQWQNAQADSLGKLGFGSNTALWFQQLQKHWFDHWLKGIDDLNFPEATCFQTGSNQWKTYNTWPPKEASIKKLYASQSGTCGFDKPTNSKGSVSYVSDPAKPVPYCQRPIAGTYHPGSLWYFWQVEDQRFVSSRPDVVNFTGESLENDLTVTGSIKAHLSVSTTATDADFIVKLIDVYPDIDNKNLLMSGYELPIAMEVFRGRFRKSFERPEPFTPNKPEEIVIDLHQVNHRFLKGHRLMIQIQSTWFPLIDRNPQKFVPNIFEANETDFIKATHTIYCNSNYSTYIELPVLKE